MKALYAVGLDMDTGIPSATVDAAMKKCNRLAIRYTTHSHLKTRTQFKLDPITKWAKGEEIDDALIQRFVREEKHWEEAIASSARYVKTDHTERGIMVLVDHDAMPKHRLVFPFAAPFVIADEAKGTTQQAAMDRWSKIPLALAESLGLPIDKTGIDPSRLFFFPRHAKGAPFEITITGGDLFDWNVLELDNPFEQLAREGARGDGKSKTDAGRELGRWSRTYGERFQIADVIEAECPDRIRGKASAGVDIECPFDEGHSNAGESDDRACFAVNAGEGTSDWFAVSCRHDSCREFTNLDMLAKMLADGWFGHDVLTDENYVGIDPNAPAPDNAANEQATEKARSQYKDAIDSLSTKSPSEEIDRVIALVARAQLGRTAKESAVLKLKAKTAYGMQLLRDELHLAEEPYRPKPKPKPKAPGASRESSKARFEYFGGSFDFEDACDFCIGAVKQATQAIKGEPGKDRLPVFTQLDSKPARLSIEKGEIKYKSLTETAYWSELNKRVAFVRKSDKAETSGEEVPDKVAKYLFHQTYDLLPPTPEILHTPTFLKSGSLLVTEGYHRGSDAEPLNCVLQLNGLVPPAIPDPPSPEETEESLAWIMREILGDFPFWDYDRDGKQTEEPGKANALAMLITPFMRRMIPGPTPVFFVTKPQPNIGGTLLATTPIRLFEGIERAPVPYSKSENEFQKALVAAFMERRSYIFFDNLSELKSQALLVALTGETVGGRKLGHSVLVERENDLNWVASGINPSVSAEMDRRLCPIRLFDRTPEGKQRKYRHADFKLFLAENRATAIRHILTLIENWRLLDCPEFHARKLDSFERWSRIVGGVLQACGVKGFLNHRATLILDPERDAENELLRLWIPKFTVGKAVSVADAYKWARDAELGIMEGKSPKEERANFSDTLRRMQQRRFKYEGKDYAFGMVVNDDGVTCFLAEPFKPKALNHAD